MRGLTHSARKATLSFTSSKSEAWVENAKIPAFPHSLFTRFESEPTLLLNPNIPF